MRGAWFAVRFTRFGALERRDDVAGEDGVVRTRAERGRTRPLVTRFGQVSESRIAYRSPGRGNVHPLDAALNLPQEKHSHGLRKLAAVEAARGSMQAAGAAITRAAGVRLGKRQVEELARRSAAHVEAFYAQRAIDPAPEDWPLILTFDGKGIVMLPGALRPATAKAAASAEGKLATGLSPGRSTAASGWPSWPASTTPPRSPAPRRTSSAPPRRNGGRGKRRPRPRARIASWREGLPPLVDTGPVPAQADLDAWVRRHTKGLIDQFPVEGGAAVTWLLATALATRLSWLRPFHLAAASALGPASPWAVTLTRVLRTPGGPGNRRVPGHDQFIAATDTAGEVAVHAVSARDGLMVVSVAAAPQVPASVVLSASYDVGTALATGRPLTRRSLFDLPLGDGAAWTITQEHAGTTAPDGKEERCTAVLPAWSAHTSHRLTDPQLGFAAVRHALDPAGPWQATQAAMARYSRTGFEAAAVTALAVAVSAPKLKPGIRRTAELRFGHPFAVVAVTTSDRAPHARHPPESPGPWHGLPVFSAWVASPEDATAEPTSTS